MVLLQAKRRKNSWPALDAKRKGQRSRSETMRLKHWEAISSEKKKGLERLSMMLVRKSISLVLASSLIEGPTIAAISVMNAKTQS